MSVCNCNNRVLLFLFVHVLHLVEVNLKKKRKALERLCQNEKKKQAV